MPMSISMGAAIPSHRHGKTTVGNVHPIDIDLKHIFVNIIGARASVSVVSQEVVGSLLVLVYLVDRYFKRHSYKIVRVVLRIYAYCTRHDTFILVLVRVMKSFILLWLSYV